jgi:hypothetical protein
VVSAVALMPARLELEPEALGPALLPRIRERGRGRSLPAESVLAESVGPALAGKLAQTAFAWAQGRPVALEQIPVGRTGARGPGPAEEPLSVQPPLCRRTPVVLAPSPAPREPVWKAHPLPAAVLVPSLRPPPVPEAVRLGEVSAARLTPDLAPRASPVAHPGSAWAVRPSPVVPGSQLRCQLTKRPVGSLVLMAGPESWVAPPPAHLVRGQKFPV